MSVKLTGLERVERGVPPIESNLETAHITETEWRIICAAGDFGMRYTYYSPSDLRLMAGRLELVKDAPRWLRLLASFGGANLS